MHPSRYTHPLVLLALAVSQASGVAQEQGEPAPTEPTGAPLELRLIAKRTAYAVELGGRTPQDFAALLVKEGQRHAWPGPVVVLVAELHNTGKHELHLVGDPTPELHLRGPTEASVIATGGRGAAAVADSKRFALAAGKSITIVFRSLEYISGGRQRSVVWTEAGGYTLMAVFPLAVSPPPPGSPLLKHGGEISKTRPGGSTARSRSPALR